MSIREKDFGNGTAVELKGNQYTGKLSVEENGFNFHDAVGQKELSILLPSQCNNIDLRLGNIFKISLTSNIANFDVSYPNIGTYLFIFEQDSSGGKTVAFSDQFYFISGLGSPNFSGDSAGTINIVSFLCDGTKFYGTYMQDFVNS